MGPDQYQMFFSLIPDLACICSADGRFTRLNPAWEETLGYPMEELIGCHFLDFVHPDDRLRTLAELGKQDFDYCTAHFKNRYVCKDGSFRWFEWNSATTKDGAEIYALARDITQRVQAEEELQRKDRQCQELDRINDELRKSQELLQAIVNGTTDCIFAKDLEGRFLLVNDKAAAISGRRSEDVLGQTDHVLFHAEEVGALRENDLAVAASRRSVTVQETVTDGSGRKLIFHSTKGPLFDKDGNVNAIFGVCRNVTVLVQAEDALIQNQEQLRALAIELSVAEERERRRIAAELHDEIGQNLALVKIKLHDLHLNCKMSASCGKSMKYITELMESTIQEVRTLTFQISPPLLYEVGFEAAVEWLAEQFEETHALQITIKNDSPRLRLGEELSSTLYHVVRELLVNVVKHARAKKIAIALQRTGSRMQISVSDDGIGFPIRGEAAGREKLGGFGLFNIRQRIQHLGGELEIESGSGSGVRVAVVVPLAEA